MNDPELPLAEGTTPDPPADREREIAELVDRFYLAARRDPLLGPVFDEEVDDWEAHLSTMRNFWSSAVYRTGRYSGRPLDAHRSIPGLQGEHFRAWVSLWNRTVDEVVRSDAREPLRDLAARMAASMSFRLGLAPERDVRA